MATTILQKKSGWNPFFLDEKEIHCIYFYKDGIILASTRWFGKTNEYKTLELPFEVRYIKARTLLNLNRKDAFCILHDADKYTRDYDLYIHADLTDLKNDGEETLETWYAVHNFDIMSITLKGHKRINGTYTYGTYKESIRTNAKVEDTDMMKKCEKLSKDIKELTFIDLNPNLVHALLLHYNITKKRK